MALGCMSRLKEDDGVCYLQLSLTACHLLRDSHHSERHDLTFRDSGLRWEFVMFTCMTRLARDVSIHVTPSTLESIELQLVHAE